METPPGSPSSSSRTPECSTKSPRTALLEVCHRERAAPPEFRCSIGSPDHTQRLLFEVIVEAFDLQARGRGYNKREARHDAAVRMLLKLKARGVTTGEANLTVNIPLSPENDVAGNLQDIQNVIGALQELCIIRHWSHPRYVSEKSRDLGKGPSFRVSCTVANIRQIGEGRTKKAAKHEAAFRTWRIVIDLD